MAKTRKASPPPAPQPRAYRRLRYVVAPDGENHQVIDIWTGVPVMLGQAEQIGLALERATKLAWKMNWAAQWDRRIFQ